MKNKIKYVENYKKPLPSKLAIDNESSRFSQSKLVNHAPDDSHHHENVRYKFWRLIHCCINLVYGGFYATLPVQSSAVINKAFIFLG
jgi:hypothetical protein